MTAFAAAHQLALVDPTAAMAAAVARGADPFMTYDSHWSALGHSLVAEAVTQTLRSSACP